MSNNQLTTYEAKYVTDAGDQIALNNEIVRKVLAAGDNITDVELYSFIKLCEYQKLNPFIKEAYLIKFGKQSQMVVGVDVFTNRLNEHPLCEGWKAGLIIEKAGEIINREGTFYLKGQEKIVGAWFNVHRKGWKEVFPWTVTFSEYYREIFDKETNKYRGQGQWSTMPATMIVKCAITSGCRKAFPKKFSGMYSPEEMGIDTPEDGTIVIDSGSIQNDLIDEEQIQNIKQAAKSNLVDFDSTKLIEFVFDLLKKKKQLGKSITLENLPGSKYKLVLKSVKDAVLVKEKQSCKDGVLPDREKIDDKLNNETDLPVVEMNYAIPANNKDKKADKENKDKKANKENENPKK